MKPKTSKSPLIFFTTFLNQKAALQFADKVVQLKLAACVNVLPSMKSVYFWKNKIHRDNEVLVIGKTTNASFKKLKAKMKSLHTYEVPELIAVKISDGLPDYLEWVKSRV